MVEFHGLTPVGEAIRIRPRHPAINSLSFGGKSFFIKDLRSSAPYCSHLIKRRRPGESRDPY
jgi:hypothetical protein